MLRVLQDDDIEDLTLWRNDAALCHDIMATVSSVTEETTAHWLNQTNCDPNQIALGIHASDPRKTLLGIFRLMNLDGYSQTAEVGMYIGSPSERGKGTGRRALKAGLHYAFSGLRLRKVWLKVLVTNQAAINLYLKECFRVEGELREHFLSNGELLDVKVMGLMATEFEPEKPRPTAADK